jgi:hypothetical protein
MKAGQGSRLALVFAALWHTATSQTTYIEDTLYMMESDTKVIRLQDFMHSGIKTEFEFKPIDELNLTKTQNATGLPESMEISPSKTNLFYVTDTTLEFPNKTAVDMKNFKDMNAGVDQFFMAQDDISFYLLYLTNPKTLTLQGMIKYDDSPKLKALYSNIIESHTFTFFFGTVNNSKILRLHYAYLDSLSDQKLIERLVDDLILPEKDFLPENYKVNVNRTSSTDFDIFGYHGFSFSHARVAQFFYFRIYLDQTVYKADKFFLSLNFTGSKPFDLGDLQLKYDMVSAGILATPKVRMVVKGSSKTGKNRYFTIECTMNINKTIHPEASTATCGDPVEIKNFRLLSGTNNRGIDLGYGRFGIITEQFLLYPVDDSLSRFEKIYMDFGKTYVLTSEPPDPLPVKFSEKNEKFIALAFGNPQKRNVEDYYIIEYLSSPPEVSKTTGVNLNYLRLQKGNLFIGENTKADGKDSLAHLAISFQDAYIVFKGSVVHAKKDFVDNPNQVMDTFRFSILSKTGKELKESKNFTVNLVRKVLEAVEFKVPYTDVKVIRGGRISLAIKEDYFVGNDVALTLSTSVPNVTTTIESSYKAGIRFSNFEGLNDPVQLKSVAFIRLLWDNLLLVVQNKTESQQQASICFLKTADNTADGMVCNFKTKIDLVESYEVKGAWLLNFDHLIMVFRSMAKTSSVNEIHMAAVYFIGIGPQNGKAISEKVYFDTMKPKVASGSSTTVSFICYTYSASAVITYITDSTSGNKVATNLTTIKFKQNSENRYDNETKAVNFDSSLIERLDSFVPDYSSKYFFYVGILDKSGKLSTYQAIIKENAGKLTLVKMKELSSSLKGTSSTFHNIRYCAGLQELVAIGDEDKSEFQRLISVPFKVKYPVYEKMVRILPLRSLNLTNVTEYECLGEHNSLIGLGFHKNQTDDKLTTLINYDLDLIHDPRRRVEAVTKLHNVSYKGIMLTASSASYAYKDFVVISHVVSGSGKDEERQFLYIAQPIKDISFHIKCPYSVTTKVPLTLNLHTPHLKDEVSRKQVINLDVKQLDYSTEIRISNSGKLQKKKGFYDLEKYGLMSVVGHFFNVKLRLMNSTENRLLGDKDNVAIKSRLREKEQFSVNNSMEIRKINNTYILREVTGNLDIFYDKTNRSKSLTISMQCNSLNADFVANIVTHSELYLFTVEDIIGGVNVSYRQINHEKLIREQDYSVATTKYFSKTYEGVYGTPVSLYCGSNFYFIMYSKVTNEIQLSVLRPNQAEGIQVTSRGNVTIPLPEIPLATELICFNDDKNTDKTLKNSSVAMIVVFQNQSQVLYKYNGETSLDKVKRTILNFEVKDKIFFIDVECDISEAKYNSGGKIWDIYFKCFYSTRWSNDLIVKHFIQTNEETLVVKSSQIYQEVQEIKDFDIAKIIMEDNKLLVAGFNLREDGLQRKVYILVYDFNMEGSTYVTSYFNIDNFMNLDYDRFRQLIHVCNDGAIVYLDKSNPDSNTFDKAYSLEIDHITLQVKDPRFNPHEIHMEVLDMSGDVMERISLFNLFDMSAEIDSQSKHPFGTLMVYFLVGSILLLALSSIFYLVMNRLYEGKMKTINRSAATALIRDSIKAARASFVADIDLEGDEGHDIINELMKSSKVELQLK